MEYKQKGRWGCVGESEIIKCYHCLVDEIKDTDTRLAKNQKYKVRGRWKLDHVTWNKNEEDFEVYTKQTHFGTCSYRDWAQQAVIRLESKYFEKRTRGSTQKP